MNEAIVFDVETGGFSETKNMLLSITLKKVGSEDLLTLYLKPNNDLICTPGALKVNGLDLDWLEKNGITELEAVQKVKQFLSEKFEEPPKSVGQNVKFDIRFMDALFKRCNDKPFIFYTNRKFSDTRTMMQRYIADKNEYIENYKLGTIYKHLFGESFEDAHTSEADVLATEKVYLEIYKHFNGQ
jgi:DNA polymerase III epsilon subunit-like protein